MAVADWAFLGVLAVSLIIGAWRGLVYEVLSVLGWALSFYLAQFFAPDVAGRLPLQGASEPVRYAAAFVLVFVLAVLLAGLVAVLFKKMVEAIGLRPVDRTLGAAFGLVRGVILLLALTVVVNMTAFKSSIWWQQSQGAEVLTAALKGLKPVLPEQFAKYLVTE
ncbi:MAG: CvpA family protein [Polaromonas sp.]|uniref:CvpA family protein n=1 Tax=Polaromonas sp. TaxID=1869339 RepID=UPI002730C0E7|nr:CvpA family protein [Polaromonas sp.]MDP1742776.1 CvpA family protein [Polaromonas sp.]MDP1955525.1 CvpA family protein [Polaromonas sp.]MDP3356343.1 CvpA family protein [Polaromonas sp.]MDP3753363.1 CvpA family protein [Polaromonas sp.]